MDPATLLRECNCKDVRMVERDISRDANIKCDRFGSFYITQILDEVVEGSPMTPVRGLSSLLCLAVKILKVCKSCSCAYLTSSLRKST